MQVSHTTLSHPGDTLAQLPCGLNCASSKGANCMCCIWANNNGGIAMTVRAPWLIVLMFVAGGFGLGGAACNSAPPPPAATFTATREPTPTITPTATPPSINLKNLAQVGQRARLGRGTVRALQWAPDGKALAVGGSIGLYVYDAQLWGDPTFFNLNRPVFDLAYHPDGTRWAILSDDAVARWLDATSGKVALPLEGHTQPPRHLSLSNDGATFVTAGFQEVLIWELSGQIRQTLTPTLSGPIIALALSPDGQTLAIGKVDGAIDLWSVTTGQLARTLVSHTSVVQSLAFSPDGVWLASGSADTTVRVWAANNPTQNTSILTFTNHTGPVTTLAFSADRQLLASGGDTGDNTIRVWDLGAGRGLNALVGHNSAIQDLAFAPDTHTLASVGADATVRVWNADTGQAVTKLGGFSASINQLSLNADGRIGALASGSEVRVWDAQTLQFLGTFRGHLGSVTSVALSPDGLTTVSGGDDASLRWQDVNIGQQRVAQTNLPKVVMAVAFSPMGDLVATGAANGDVQIWNAASAQWIATFEGHTASIAGLAFSPDGKRLASVSSSADDPIRLWNVATGQVAGTMAGQDCVAFSPDGRWLASGDLAISNAVLVWDVKTGKLSKTLEGHTGDVTTVAFSPDSALLVSGGRDHALYLWDVVKGVALRALEGHTDALTSVTFTPDGRGIFSASADGTARLWGLPRP
jgi:WD40 repeat protein